MACFWPKSGIWRYEPDSSQTLSAETVADRELHIYEMSVVDTCQGLGLGRALVQAAINWAVANHLAALTLTTFRDVPWNAPYL